MVFTLKVNNRKVKMIPLIMIIQVLLVIFSVAIYTLLERKTLGYIQRRKGPNKPSFIGLLVPFADALKLIGKESNDPHKKTNYYSTASQV